MNSIEKLIGKKVLKIRMNEQNLVFETDDGVFAFGVEGDCCSSSYFYDFYGVENLLENGAIKSVREIPLEVRPESVTPSNDFIEAYGFELVTNNKYWGDKTSVFSFRNDSNGYYGGWMEDVNIDPETVPEITKDTLL